MFIEYSDVPAFWHIIVVITPPKMMPLVMLLLVSSPAIVWSPGAKRSRFSALAMCSARWREDNSFSHRRLSDFPHGSLESMRFGIAKRIAFPGMSDVVAVTCDNMPSPPSPAVRAEGCLLSQERKPCMLRHTRLSKVF